MPFDGQRLWSCVGSAGVVNLPDVGKIIFSNSIAQLGPGQPIIVKQNAQPEAAPNLPTQTVSAIIRYGVVPVHGVYGYPPDLSLGIALKLRYRGGSGRVVAKFIQVNIQSGTETTLLTFDSQQPGAVSSNAFQVLESPASQPALDFVGNAYYVELTLTVTERTPVLPAYPPAVAVVQLAFAQPVIP